MENKRANCIIEVSVDSANGRYAVGIMNMRQALDLPEMPSLSYTHPDPVKAAAGIVKIHAHTIRPATPHLTADKRRVAPTPTIDPVMVCVVETGVPVSVT